jgi:hypothetical protein
MTESDFDLGPSCRAVLFEFNRRGTIQDRQLDEIYAGSGAAWWAYERTGKYSEIVEPELLYVTPNDEMHRVVWVKHVGVRENRLDQLVPYSVHHVVCDCAAEIDTTLEEEEKTTGFPRSTISCEYVQNVLTQRAGELATRNRIQDVLGTYTLFDEEEQDFRLTGLGQELTIRAIAQLMEVDKLHPETWVANRVSGLHEVGLLAAFVGYGTEEIMPLLEMMEQGNIINISGDEVKLTPEQLVKIVGI